jgi:hypothetical protein
MLQEIQIGDPADMTLDATYRAGRPQANVCQRYLAKLNDCADTRATEAFAAVLTGFLAEATHFGSPPDLGMLNDDYRAVRS